MKILTRGSLLVLFSLVLINVNSAFASCLTKNQCGVLIGTPKDCKGSGTGTVSYTNDLGHKVTCTDRGQNCSCVTTKAESDHHSLDELLMIDPITEE